MPTNWHKVNSMKQKMGSRVTASRLILSFTLMIFYLINLIQFNFSGFINPRSQDHNPSISTYSICVMLCSRYSSRLFSSDHCNPCRSDCPKQEMKHIQHPVNFKRQHNARTSDCKLRQSKFWSTYLITGLMNTYFTILSTIYFKRRTWLNIKCTQFWDKIELFCT